MCRITFFMKNPKTNENLQQTSPWITKKITKSLRFFCFALLASCSVQAQEIANPKTVAWENMANFEWDSGATFKACSKDGSTLAKVSKKNLEYRDAFSGTLLSSHSNRGAESACLSADRADLLLCRIQGQKAMVDFVPFGSGFITSTLEIPISIDLKEDRFSASLIEATPDGKYLVIVISSEYDEGELIVFNFEEKAIELTLYERFDKVASIYPPAYDQGSQILALRNIAAKEGQPAGSIINIQTGTRVPIDGRDPTGEYSRREIDGLQFIDGHLIEVNIDWASEINLDTGMRSVFATGLNDKNLDILDMMGNQMVFKEEDEPNYGILPSDISFDDFKKELSLLGEKGFIKAAWRSDMVSVNYHGSYNDRERNFIDSNVGIFITSNGDLFRKVARQRENAERNTKSRSDYEDLVKFWHRGFESKVLEWFKHKGGVRRGSWLKDYKENCPYAACILGVSVALGGDGIKSVEKGKRLLNEAIQLGFKDAVVWLALFEQDHKRTFQVLSSVRDGGSPLVLETLAQCYREGVGCEINLAEAFNLSLEAAKLDGGAASALSVARTYEKGVETVVEPNPDMAFSYFSRAAKLKAFDSEYYLAMCYLNGVGVAQSNEEAFRWFQEGISTGSVLAKYGMALCLERGVGCDTDVVGAYQLLLECSELGLEVAKDAAANIRVKAESIERERRLEYEFRYLGRTRISSHPALGGWDADADARDALRDYRNKVSGYLGVNGLIFRGGY